MEHYTRTGLILRNDRDSPVFFHYLSYTEYIGPTVELFIPYWDKPMILHSSSISGGRPPKTLVKDGGSLKESSFIRYWSETEFQNKIYIIKTFRPSVDLEERLLENAYELSNESYGWLNIGLVSEADESRGRDVVDRFLGLQSFPLPLSV